MVQEDTEEVEHMKKWIPNKFYPFETDALEYYLEQQALKGWILEYVGLRWMRFRKEAPQNLRYCVDIPSVRRKRGGTNEYLEAYYEMCESAGWNLIGTNTIFHIFTTSDPTLAPIHTDSAVKYEAALSDLRPRMFVTVICIIILYAMRLDTFRGLGNIPFVPRMAFIAIFVLVFLTQVEMIWTYVRWKRSHEEIGEIRYRETPPSLWPSRLRLVIDGVAWTMLLVMFGAIVPKLTGQLDGMSFWEKAVEVVGSPFVMTSVYLLCAHVMTKVLWKKGYDQKSGHAIGVLVGYVLMILLLALSFEMKDHEDDKQYEGYQEKIEASKDYLKTPPIAAESLGLTLSLAPMYQRDKGATHAMGKYSVVLDTGGYFRYYYYQYYQKEEAIRIWNSQNRRYADSVERYHGDGTPYHYEWHEQDLSALGAENALAVIKLEPVSSYYIYHYVMQKEDVFVEIDYCSEYPLTEDQLRVIGEALP